VSTSTEPRQHGRGATSSPGETRDTIELAAGVLVALLALAATFAALVTRRIGQRTRPVGRAAMRQAARGIWPQVARHRSRRTTGRPAQPTVSVVVPALNEAGSIDWVLENIPDWVDEVVLVDGLSVDETEVVARRIVPDVLVVHQRQPGKGAALRAGFAAASGDIIVMIDADGSTDPREIGRFVDALVAGADFVKGSRHMPGGGSVDFTLLRKAGNLAFVFLHNLLYGSRFTDLCYGYCAFWRSHLDDLALTADGFEIEMQLIANAVKAGLRIVEVSSLELERRAGDSNLNVVRDGLRVLRTLVREHPSLGSPAAEPAPIELVPVETAAPDSGRWRPAGLERRRVLDRRRSQAPCIGPERRGAGDRRDLPKERATVLLAHEPAPRETGAPVDVAAAARAGLAAATAAGDHGEPAPRRSARSG
jgi:hypothetical protein